MPDPQDFLRITAAPADLKRSAVRGGSLVLVSQAIIFGLSLAATMVLARLLSPSDFGLVAMVTAVTAFAGQFRDLGLSQATIQRTDITHGQISTLFWINALLGLAMGAVTAAASPLLAWYYHEPRLVGIALALSGTFLLSGLAVQHQALLRRQMRFGVLTAIDIGSLAVALAVALALAWRGAGYWALVLRPLISAGATTIGLWGACRWRPGRPRRGAGVRSLLAFGGDVSATNIVNYFARNLDNALLGARAGSTVLGLYSKAYQLILLPINMISSPLWAVAVPALSRLRDEPARYRSYFRNGLLPLVVLGMPGIVFLFVCARDAIRLFLGDQWIGSIAIFRLLAPAALVGTFGAATSWVYVSLGLTRRQLVWTVFSTAITVVAFFVGVRWGARGMAIAVSAAFCALQLPAILYCFRPTFLRLGDMFGVVWRPALASVAAGVGCWLFGTMVLEIEGVLPRFVLQAIVFGALYAIAWIGLPRGRASLAEMMTTLRQLRRDDRP